MSNSLVPDQARHFVGPDMDPSCLQNLSAGHKIVTIMVETWKGYVNAIPLYFRASLAVCKVENQLSYIGISLVPTCKKNLQKVGYQLCQRFG